MRKSRRLSDYRRKYQAIHLSYNQNPAAVYPDLPFKYLSLPSGPKVNTFKKIPSLHTADPGFL